MQANTMMSGVTVGADPELFVVNTEGELVSAAGLIPGTKDQPHKVEFGAIQVDGMAAEFNIDPVDNFEDFDRNIVQVMRQLKAHLPKGYKLVNLPSVTFSQEEWDRTPEEAKELGCSPDYNAWLGDVNLPPSRPLDNPTLSCAGGHLHFGWTDGADVSDTNYMSACTDLVKQLDWTLGLYSLTKDTDTRRRSLYGKAGALRFKPYGVEYRSLSNFWVGSKELRRQIWNRSCIAIDRMGSKFYPQVFPEYNEAVVSAINTSTIPEGYKSFFKSVITRG